MHSGAKRKQGPPQPPQQQQQQRPRQEATPQPTARRALARRGTAAEEAATEQWMQEAEGARVAEAQVAQARAKGKAAEEAASHAATDQERVSRLGKKRGRGQGSGWGAAMALSAVLVSMQLQSAGYVRLPGEYSDSSLSEAAQPGGTGLDTVQMADAVRSSRWQAIFNGQSKNTEPQRFHGGGGEAWTPQMARFIESTLDAHGLLRCADGRNKTVNTCMALKSAIHMQGGSAVSIDAAALLGRQPLHADAPPPARGSISDLKDEDKPLSVMVAVEPGTLLWVYPLGCSRPDEALLVELNVGDVFVWRGDIVHAGAGCSLLSNSNPNPNPNPNLNPQPAPQPQP